MASKKNFLSMSQVKQVTAWAENHKAELANMTRSDAIKACLADTGVLVPPARMIELEDMCGVVRHRGGHTMVAIGNLRTVAGELVRLMQQLDVKPSESLTKLINR